MAGRTRNEGPVTLAFALAGVALLVRLLSEGVPDIGDGIAHYQIARYAWKHPELLFDAWGKPLYTILASPFAQWGLWGPALMNALLAATTAVLIIGHVARVQRAWCWAAPVVLFAAPQYTHTVMAGLTEPLFALLAVGAVISALRDRWAWALGITSFLPFARPEYVAVLPMVVLAAAWQRQWRSLPWVLLGAVFYVAFGFVMSGDPFIAFGKSPYAGVTTYGTGPLLHFVERVPHYFGWPIIVCAVLALLAWPYVWCADREGRKQHAMVLLLAFIPAVLIASVHSYAWWKGGHGSLGLDRVMATALPLLALFVVHVLASFWKCLPMNKAMRPLFTALVCLFAVFAYPHVVDELLLPYKTDKVQTTLRSAAEKVRSVKQENDRVYFLAPYIGALLDLDIRDTSTAVALYRSEFEPWHTMHAGDILVWDAQFAKLDGQVPDSILMNDGSFSLLATYKPDEPNTVIGGVPYVVHVFRFSNVNRWVISDTLVDLDRGTWMVARDQCDTVPGGGRSAILLSEEEFPLTFASIPLGTDSGTVQESLVVHGRLESRYERDEVDLVFTEVDKGAIARYNSQPLYGGAFTAEWDIERISGSRSNKLYFWNRSGKPIKLRELQVIRTRMVQQALNK